MRRLQAGYFLVLSVTYFVLFAAFATIHVRDRMAQQREIAGNHLQAFSLRLQSGVNNAANAAYLLALFVKQARGDTSWFDDAAPEILANFPMVSALQLAPQGVIRKIYPLEGNEAAYGHDLLKDPNRNLEAHKAVASGRMTLAGPFPLLQGGMGAVARMPVMFPREGRNEFWGFANALIRIPQLLDAVQIQELSRLGYDYELWQLKDDPETRMIFARSRSEALENPIEYSISVPNGRWLVAIAPVGGWKGVREYADLYLLAAGLALFTAGAHLLIMQSMMRRLAQEFGGRS